MSNSIPEGTPSPEYYDFENRFTHYHWTVGIGTAEDIHALYQLGYRSINWKSASGMTPLEHAIWSVKADIAVALLQLGADLPSHSIMCEMAYTMASNKELSIIFDYGRCLQLLQVMEPSVTIPANLPFDGSLVPLTEDLTIEIRHRVFFERSLLDRLLWY